MGEKNLQCRPEAVVDLRGEETRGRRPAKLGSKCLQWGLGWSQGLPYWNPNSLINPINLIDIN